jgi:S1-C subfamily serine protease
MFAASDPLYPGSEVSKRRIQEKRRTMTTVMDLSSALAGAVERAARSVFAVHGRPRLPSTGVHWRPGLIVTANHTVEPDRDVTLTGPDGRTLPARVAGRDPRLDIAVLRAEVDSVPAADIADDGGIRVGHLVMALGAGPRASAGIVSALDVTGGRRPESGETLVVDLTLYPGFSGGPLIDVLGRIVGITTSGASRHLQCAVRAAAVSRSVEHVVRRGSIPRAYLGVSTQPVVLPDPLRERLSLGQRTAVIVVNIKPDSPAAAAGLIIGDIVVSMAGHAIAEPHDLVAVLQPDRVGGAVTVSILRGGEPRDLEVTVGERPSRA